MLSVYGNDLSGAARRSLCGMRGEKMKKKIMIRSIFGFPFGITISYAITIVLSLIWAKGYYAPCVPGLVETVGNEIYAVIVQAFLSGLLGAGFGACSVIWEMEDWSLVKQTGLYFILVSFLMLPIAYLTYWMEHSIAGFLCYFGIFVSIFIVIWLVQFAVARHQVRRLNANLYRAREEEGKAPDLE